MSTIPKMSSASKYNRISPIYELIDLPLELLFFRRWRKEAFSGLSGNILEVGVGTGKNLKYYPSNSLVTGIDASEGMLDIARKKAMGMPNVSLLLMDAEHLEFPDRSFDYVVTTFVLCTVPDPVKALEEMRRVLKLSGELMALEHVRSSNPLISLLEDLINPVLLFLFGDHSIRHTLENIEDAGFTVLEAKKLAIKDVFRKIRAKP
ncbi:MULTISPECIES: class I SAM-dependent methyltransferase [unclassified Methanosarcina]|uniref:class I SAM-dependent methyltransferase n=1 Tax=unclassified Methanosarcina TaxID=2644672 RepID=UPI000AAF2C69|nr:MULTISPECIES: methyltransferase domain-containing protein [unclassified Methanosarcina]